MIKPSLTLSILLLASACGTRTAPSNNLSATQSPPAAMQPAPAAPTSSAKVDAALKPQQETEASNAQGDGDGDDDDVATATPSRSSQSRPSRGCAAETSLGAAEELVRVCEQVSPATHPPCNIQNSCATIRQEIARSCRMLGDDAPEECRGG